MIKINVALVRRMYQDHGYTVDEICFRLRYNKKNLIELIQRYNFEHGKKSWRY